jgi:hypothetical protein
MQVNPPQFATPAARLTVLALFTVALAGCQGITGIQPVSQVRVIDVSPDAPALDIHQNSSATLYNVGFGTVSSYISVPAGAYTHSAYTAGTEQQVASVRGSLSAGGQYTILTGNVAANLQMTVLKDQSTPAPPGQVALRIVDEATRVGALDIYLLPPGAAPISVAPFITDATFGINTGYINAPSGTYSIVAYPTGTVPTNSVTPAYTGSQVTYPATSARTIILIDQPQIQPTGKSTLQVISAADYDSAAS